MLDLLCAIFDAARGFAESTTWLCQAFDRLIRAIDSAKPQAVERRVNTMFLIDA